LLWRLFHNRWIVFGGMGVIAFFTVFGTCLGVQRGRTVGTSDDFFVATATPPASATPSATGTPEPGATPTPTATPVQRRYAAAPPMQIDLEKQYFATIATEKGTIRVQLFPKEAPDAVNSFVFLARNKYYDGLTFQRVGPYFAQGGDAGSQAPGYTLPVQVTSLKHEPGAFVLARSNSGDGGLTAQFYIVRQPLPNQEGRDTVIGKVVEGMEVVDRLSPRDPDRTPNAPADRIISVTIDERSAG
jgi:peptidylprolyl isomerase